MGQGVPEARDVRRHRREVAGSEGLTARTAALTLAALVAFAANSLLCRGALAGGRIDAVSFTAIRLASGAAALALVASLARVRSSPSPERSGSWASAAALAAYAFAFSLAYLRIPAGVGALALFGAVQTTMIATGLARGERPGARTWCGLALALAGLAALSLRGATAPDGRGLALMLAAGVAWGVYSLRGRGAADPVAVNAANFLRTLPLAAAAALVALAAAEPRTFAARPAGVALAVVSGAVTSGLGYAVWYRALRGLSATQAAIVQLAVVPLAALGGVALLDETLTPRLVVTGAAILGGVLLAVTTRASSEGGAGGWRRA